MFAQKANLGPTVEPRRTCRGTMAIKGLRPRAVHTPRRYRESIASLGSAPGTLSAHHKVDTGEDGCHLSPWDFANSLGQSPFVDGHKLGHIHDAIAVLSSVLRIEKHIARGDRPAKVACQSDAHGRRNLALVQRIRLHHDHRPTIARG
jgi:hypothetical protein